MRISKYALYQHQILLWNKLDKEKESDSNKYKNLLELDNKLFNSLQLKDIHL